MQAMTANSKVLATSGDRATADKVRLPMAFIVHAQLHEGTVLICQQLAADLNSDYPALFNEKKYKELQLIAKASQTNILQQLKC